MGSTDLHSLEICAGAGGQALGLEQAGFQHVALVENEPAPCVTLRTNRPGWRILENDVRDLDGRDFHGIDLLSGGVPCPPFSIAGKQLGEADDRDLFPVALRLVEQSQPRAVILENVPGLSKTRFAEYRGTISARLRRLGYSVDWQVLNACNYGVPQLRPRFILVALKGDAAARFSWPRPQSSPPTVGEVLGDLMASGGWRGADSWIARANGIAPTLVGGSKKHGGPDLGPSRAKAAWRELGVDALGLADAVPDDQFPAGGLPKLTVAMTARLQGFPDNWTIVGRKTAAYRQVGNAFPSPVAYRVGKAVRHAILGARSEEETPRSQFQLQFVG
jgi:DNA (cytosine-5)-methyltransferase 1